MFQEQIIFSNSTKINCQRSCQDDFKGVFFFGYQALMLVDPQKELVSHCLKLFWLRRDAFFFINTLKLFFFLEMVDTLGSIGLRENPETSAFFTSRSRVFYQSFSVNSFTSVT